MQMYNNYNINLTAVFKKCCWLFLKSIGFAWCNKIEMNSSEGLLLNHFISFTFIEEISDSLKFMLFYENKSNSKMVVFDQSPP